jgi:hypothetical protein
LRWSSDAGFVRIAWMGDPEDVLSSAGPMDVFKTYYAQEGLIVSKCVCMDVKQLPPID